MKDPIFLALDDVVEIHKEQVALFGGLDGIRDVGLLESALATPSATFGGAFLHETIFEMAAAYLCHIARNHAFLDGNKRTALAVTLNFLNLNGVWIETETDKLYSTVLGAAKGEIAKSEVAVFLQTQARES